MQLVSHECCSCNTRCNCFTWITKFVKMLPFFFSGSQIDIHGDRENVPKDRQIPRDLQPVGPSRLVSQWILGAGDLRPITAVWKSWEWEVGELQEAMWSPVSASFCQPRVLRIGPASVCWCADFPVTSVLSVICRVLSELNGCYKLLETFRSAFTTNAAAG